MWGDVIFCRTNSNQMQGCLPNGSVRDFTTLRSQPPQIVLKSVTTVLCSLEWICRDITQQLVIGHHHDVN